ncbi:MAG: Holliday junction resolvase RuvX [Anaerolineales bacterium]|jgi:putative Holliday junction resolvase|nr:MAG: Holliday junction resolvase RuvX [Anaerolineales bacterium]
MRILALDVGEQRTGVALSDPLGVLASPLTVLTGPTREAQLEAIEQLTRKHQVEKVIVGYPRSLSGAIGPQAQRVDQYVEQLRAHLQVPVVLWDERLSTAQAERLIHETGRSVQRERIDAAAAAVILQSYLDAQALTGDSQARP